MILLKGGTGDEQESIFTRSGGDSCGCVLCDKNEGGSTIAYGRLYRGAERNRNSEYGREVALNTMSVAADIDLRGRK